MRKTDFLLRDARLNEAKDWLKKHRDDIAPQEKEFIKRSIRRANGLRVGVFVMVLSFAIVAGWQWWESDKARKKAESMSWVYLAQQEILKGNPVNAIWLALEALPKNFSDPGRPLVTQAIETLYQALFNLAEHPLMHKDIIGVSEKYVASLGEKGKIHLWRRADAKLISMFGESTEEVNSVIFSSDSSKLLAYSKDNSWNNTVYIWDVAKAAKAKLLLKLSANDWKMTFDDNADEKLAKPPYTQVSYANFISNSDCVLIRLKKLKQDKMSDDDDAKADYSWNIKAQAFSGKSDIKDDKIICDGKKLTKPADVDTLPEDWLNASSPLLITQITHPTYPAYQIAKAVFKSDGEVVTTSRDKMDCQWEIHEHNKTQEPWAVIHGKMLSCKEGASQDSTGKMEANPDGNKTLTINGDSVTLQIEGDELQLKMPKHEEYDQAWVLSVTYATFSPDSQTVLTASNDNTVRLWNAQNGQLIDEPPLKEVNVNVNVNHALFLENKIILVSEHTVTVWDISSDESFKVMNFDDVRQIDVSFDGSQVITVFHDGTAKIWRLFLEPQELVDFANKVVS